MKHTVKRVPVILQMEAVECGAASLAMVLAYYKRYIPLEQLRMDCNVSRDGSNAKYIALAGRYHGLNVKALRLSVEAAQARTDFPMIIHWNFNHFVVLCGFRRNHAVINDPASGRVEVSMEEFDQSFTGIALTFSPSELFQRQEGGNLRYKSLLSQLRGSGGVLVFAMTMGVIMALLELTKPVFYKEFTDVILLAGYDHKLLPLLTGMAVVLILSFIAAVSRQYYLFRLRTKLTVSVSSGFMWHLLHLPVAFFAQRYIGDISGRLQSTEGIYRLLCVTLLPVLLDTVMILLYLAVMIRYSLALSLIGIVMACLNLLFTILMASQTAGAVKNVQRDDGKLSGVMLSTVSMIETIKSSGAEEGVFEQLSGYHAKYASAMLELREKSTAISTAAQILTGLSSGAVLMLGVSYIFDGRFTIGALMAFQSFLTMFLTPIGSLSASTQSLQTVNGSLDRINDVMRYPEDIHPRFTRDAYEKLSGRIEINNLRFAYSRLAQPLIRDFTLTIEPGQTVALVGGSGSGKSTIAKLISGLYQPLGGEILLDGVPVAELDRDVLAASLAVVDQTISLFSGTLRENLTMWDPSVPEDVLIQACRDACIHDEIIALQNGYDANLAEGGSNFSGGQRQRLEIARALAAQPSILILDEATSALDTMTEKLVMDAVKRRNITCLVIAHRLSTIRDADQIIMLDHGEAVEQGTHEELVALGGRYKALVDSD